MIEKNSLIYYYVIVKERFFLFTKVKNMIYCLCKGVKLSDCPGTGFTGTYQPPCKSWEFNPDPLEEQSVFVTAKPSLQPLGLSS